MQLAEFALLCTLAVLICIALSRLSKAVQVSTPEMRRHCLA